MPGNIAELHVRMDAIIKGYPYAKAAIEFAAYDVELRAHVTGFLTGIRAA